MRPVDADKLLDDIKAAKECGGMGAIVAGTLRRYVMRQPTITPPNEPLTCEGCDMQSEKVTPCASCIRDPRVCDYYTRRPPERQEDKVKT